MIHDPYASLHIGLSAEAMMLIDPQLGDASSPGGTRRGLLLSVILSVALVMLPPVITDPLPLLSH